MNFTPVDNTGRVDGYCLVKSVETKTSSKGDTYLDFTLGDSTGEINGKLWRYSVVEHGEYKANDIVKIRGTISQYNGADQLRIERIRHTIESDNVRIEDFVRTTGYDSEQMYNELMNIANGFTDNSSSFDGSQQTFPKLLQQQGYETAVIGKWHLTSDPTGCIEVVVACVSDKVTVFRRLQGRAVDN